MAQKEDSVAEEAREALHRAAGNVEEAAKLLAARVRKIASLRRAILEPLIDYACHNAVGRIHRQNRETIWNAPAARADLDPAARVAALAADNLLMFPLLDGVALGDATRADIIRCSEFYGRQATDMAHKARWLLLVGQSVPEGKKTKDVLSNARLRELQQEARDA